MAQLAHLDIHSFASDCNMNRGSLFDMLMSVENQGLVQAYAPCLDTLKQYFISRETFLYVYVDMCTDEALTAL